MSGQAGLSWKGTSGARSLIENAVVAQLQPQRTVYGVDRHR